MPVLGYHRFTFPGDRSQLNYTRYPFTAGWTGSWVYEKSPTLIFHCAQDSNPSSLGCEPSVLPLHHTAPIFVPGSGPPTRLITWYPSPAGSAGVCCQGKSHRCLFHPIQDLNPGHLHMVHGGPSVRFPTLIVYTFAAL